MAPDAAGRSSLMDEVRREFSARRDVHDVATIKYLVSDGVSRLAQLKSMLHSLALKPLMSSTKRLSKLVPKASQ